MPLEPLMLVSGSITLYNVIRVGVALHSMRVMIGIQSLSPNSKTFLDLTTLQDMAAKYNISAEDLFHEVYQAKRLLNRKSEEGISVSSLQQLTEFMEPYKDAFYALFN